MQCAAMDVMLRSCRDMTPILLFVVGVLVIYATHRTLGWMERRGWIYYRRRRGTSAALGNALLQVQSFYQPSVTEILEVRLEEPVEEADSGDPPSPGHTNADGTARHPASFRGRRRP